MVLERAPESRFVKGLADGRRDLIEARHLGEERTRGAIRPLLTKKIIAEHKRNPLGDHSDTLARVLNYQRRSPALTPYVIICTRPFREWRIARLSGVRGAAPAFVDDHQYASEAKAMHALFLTRIEVLMRD